VQVLLSGGSQHELGLSEYTDLAIGCNYCEQEPGGALVTSSCAKEEIMADFEHVTYSRSLLSSLSDDGQETEVVDFVASASQPRNAAKALAAILCKRLGKTSSEYPKRLKNSNYAWNSGTFNCRNIVDRDYLWTNVRRSLADTIHLIAQNGPTAYLLACCSPGKFALNVWALPEPLLYGVLEELPAKEGNSGGQEYTIEIAPDKQRIERFANSPNLLPYFRRLQLSDQEYRALQGARATDQLAKEQRNLIEKAEQGLIQEGAFDPADMVDSRERVFAAIVRRRGQPAFRKKLLVAYHGRCAISGYGLEAVLDAAHIVPYRGQATNHATNGLILRTDLHTLFDLKLIAIDFDTMRLLISPSLKNSEYAKLQGTRVRVPDEPEFRPNEQAIRQHLQESGL
jgi:HNH endonuclease